MFFGLMEVLTLTETQKQNIIVLRKQGLSFGQIAEKVDISVNTVKSFCRRMNLQCISASKESESKENKENEHRNTVEVHDQTCRQCGAPLKKVPKVKPKQFCCDACRTKWWNIQRSSQNRKGMTTTTCACCGMLFASYQSMNRRFCSHACYIRARFEKEAAI